MINWINSFLRDRSITFAINRRTIEQFAIQTSISQKFSIFSLLYLFYNADLLKMCDRLDTNTRSLRYADDVNILTYDKSTKKNCRTLKRVHRLCEKWTARHEFVFASIKYELIHFTRNSKKFNMIVILNIVNNIIESKTNIRVLELEIVTKLKWDSHVRKIQKKMIRQSMTLIKISALIREIIFSKSRIVYIFVVRSIMIYVSSIWHMLKKKRTSINEKLTMLQNKCLRIVTNVFRVTFIFILKTETYIISMNIHLNQLQTQTRLRLRIELCATFITNSCKAIAYKLRDCIERRRRYRSTLDEQKHVWAAKQSTISVVLSRKNSQSALWSNRSRISFDRDKFVKQRVKDIKEHHDKQWANAWTIYKEIVFDSISTQNDCIDKKRLKLHERTRKAESSLITQIRTKKIDFANFLHRRKILEIDSSTCRCDWNR
jgi:hypothetical protein